MSSWIGFRSTTVEFDVQEREAGESKWSTRSLIRYALTNIVGYSSAPMQMVTGAGAVVFLMAVVLGIQTLVKYFSGHAVEGFTTVILLLLFIGSVIMISLGIIGYYISRIYEEVKGRPRYIISRKIQGENAFRKNAGESAGEKLMRELYQKYKEIIRYLIVGVLTTVVSLASYYLCVYTILDPDSPLQLQAANVISWIAAVTFAYFTNRSYVFESKNQNRLGEAAAFYGGQSGYAADGYGLHVSAGDPGRDQ